jgi:hypothetical protein
MPATSCAQEPGSRGKEGAAEGSGISLATGLNAMAPDPGMLIAFNATPGSSAPTENGPYSFAQALTEAIEKGRPRPRRTVRPSWHARV